MAVPAENIKLDKNVLYRGEPLKRSNFMHVDLSLFNRRKRLLMLYYSGNLNQYSLKALHKQLNESNARSGINKRVTMAALYKDLQRLFMWTVICMSLLCLFFGLFCLFCKLALLSRLTIGLLLMAIRSEGVNWL